MKSVTSFADCISDLERKQRLTVYVVSVFFILIWLLFAFATYGLFVLLSVIVWLINYLLAEYNVRKLQAVGVTVSPRQFPEVHAAASEVAQRFSTPMPDRIVVLPVSSMNALAIRFAQKKVVVLFSELLEGIIDHPDQLRALLAHEMCHSVLDHGPRRYFELYKPARFKQGRELTCDNAGLVAAGNFTAAKELLRRLAAGNRLSPRLNEQGLLDDATHVESGLVGWLIKQYLTHPPVGSRIRNIEYFGSQHNIALPHQNPPTPLPAQ